MLYYTVLNRSTYASHTLNKEVLTSGPCAEARFAGLEVYEAVDAKYIDDPKEDRKIYISFELDNLLCLEYSGEFKCLILEMFAGYLASRIRHVTMTLLNLLGTVSQPAFTRNYSLMPDVGAHDTLRRYTSLESISIIVHDFEGFKIDFNAPLHKLIPLMEAMAWTEREDGDYCFAQKVWKTKFDLKKAAQPEWKEPVVNLVRMKCDW